MKCDMPGTIMLSEEKSAKLGVNTVPYGCGKCYNCKATRIQQWSFRLQKELEGSTSAYFVTLTYDTHHVPIVHGRYPMTLVKNSKQDKELRLLEITDDEQQAKNVLERSDRSLQAFFKRLRYYEDENRVQFDPRTKKLEERKQIKYYACGEYGKQKKRPHYHAIIFNVGYTSSIERAWSTAVMDHGEVIDYIPFGNIDIDSDVNSTNIEYVLKYICKSDKRAGIGRDDNRIPEFSLMSKGLGKNFITPEIETFYNRRLDISYVVNQSGVKVPLPRYYANKMFNENTKEDRAIVIKNQIEEAEKKDLRSDQQKQCEKIARQALMNNYKIRE